MSNKNKVGVITIHDADNYGSDLQAYATQKAVENLGYESYIIDHVCKKISSEYGIKRILAQKGIKSKLETVLRVLTLRNSRKKFIEFRKNNYRLIKEDFDQEEFKKIIVGSDQVFNYKITGMDKAYFLDFVKDNDKKVAFSSSFGISKIPEDLKKEYSDCLTGKEVPLVLDPTFLIPRNDWDAVCNMPYKESGYIVCYQIAHSKTLVDFAEELAKKTGKKIISIQGSLRQRFNAKYIWNAGPAEYVGLIKNADYVITNSFHGTAFSINFNKKFFTELLPSFEKTNSRLESILDLFGLRERQIINGKNNNMLAEINYEPVNKILDDKRKESLEILKNFIED